MKSRAIIVLFLFALFPAHAQATPGWCFTNVDGQQVCGATFEESTAQLIADMNVRNDRLFAQRAIDDAAAQAAQLAEWRRQAEDQAARDAEMIRISNENAAINAAAEAARLAAEQQGSSSENNSPPPSDPTPESDQTPPSDLTPSNNSPEIIDCALPQYYDHTNCGGPRPTPSSYTQQDVPNSQQVVSNTQQDSSRIEAPQLESQISKAVETQVDERISSKNEVSREIEAKESIIVQDAAGNSEEAKTPEKPTITEQSQKLLPVVAAKKSSVKKSSSKKASLKKSSTKKAMTVLKISCYKGKSVIVISSSKPLCPTGYKQK